MPEHVEVHLKHASVRIEDLEGRLLGTGIVLPWGDAEAVLTCAHLVPVGPEPAPRLKVSFAGERRGVRSVWRPQGADDPGTVPYRSDLALLTLEAPLPGAAPIPWTSAVPRAGAIVWFHGFRAGQNNPETMRTGISAWNDEHGCLMLQDAPARGTSGGPVCVEDGASLHLVGMVIARVVDTAARGVVLPAATIRDQLPAEHPMALVPQITPADRPSQIRQRLQELDEFARNFQIERTIGHSERAVVYLAKDLDLDREVAIKVLDPDVDPAEHAAFAYDVRIAARFDHPGIVRILDATLRGPLPRFVMEFIDGPPLRKLLEYSEEQFDVEALASIVEQVGDALAYMHRRGFIHGGVSDGNIMIDRNRAGHTRAVISAFGVTPAVDVADALPSRRSTRDARSDQFFLGRVAHELFPHAFARTPSPPELAAVVMKMLHLDPEQRFPSVAEAVAAFRAALHAEDLVPGPAPAPVAAASPWSTAEPPAPEVIERARIAYERWRRLPRFFESFYDTLFAKDPSIGRRFSTDGRTHQPEKLRRALDLVLKFPRQAADEEPLLDEIARSHSFHGAHKVPPHLYPIFESALLETATRRDPDFDARQRQAWRAVLSYTFDFMQSRYY